MSWAPGDLVSDADLVAYERTILTQFQASDWQARRQKALEDWLFPLLEMRGFDPQRWRTRYVATAVVSSTSSVLTDRTAAAASSEGLALAPILAASSDWIAFGYKDAFRGLSIRQLEQPNATAASLTVQVWTGAWQAPEELLNDTLVGAVSLAKGGSLTWTVPESLVQRVLNGVTGYWARIKMSAAPAACVIGPVAVVKRSRLCAPVTVKTLALIFREAPIAQDGPWQEKADYYERAADAAWLRVADQIGSEFDMDKDDVINASEEDQTAAEASGGGWRWERA